MRVYSPELDTAICALWGDSDWDILRYALDDPRLASIIACAPDAHLVIRTIAALRIEFIDLIDARMVADPDMQTAMVRLIGTREGKRVIDMWAQIAPAGWGHEYAAALINAVNNGTCAPQAAAALIGPCDDAAALLTDADAMASVIRHWGQSTPDMPTAWMHALSLRERRRLLNEAQRIPSAAACCLPWLPPERVKRRRIDTRALGDGLDAFASASPSARVQHADLLMRCVSQAHPEHLSALTRLACAMNEDDVWHYIQTLIRKSPDSARDVVITAPWDDLPEKVRDVVADLHDSIGAARGRRDRMMNVSEKNAAAFFAALDPQVWNALDITMQQGWLQALNVFDGHLAVRSLGLHPEIIARAWLNNDLVRAVRRHAHNASTLCWTLLPLALRDASVGAARRLMTALPTSPPDLRAFFVLESWHPAPSSIAAASTALQTHADLVLAIVLRRCANRNESIRDLCTALQETLHGQTWHVLTSIMSLLDDDVRAVIIPDADSLVNHLAHPNRKEQMRQTLVRLASLPPDVAIPISVTLARLALRMPTEFLERNEANVIANVLRFHGDMFLSLMDSLTDNLRIALLPLPKDAALADALREFAQDNPPVAQRLAYALRDQSWRTSLRVLLSSPPRHFGAVWRALDDAASCAIADEIAEASQNIVNPVIIPETIAALIRASWDTLPQGARSSLHRHPSFADLPAQHAHVGAHVTRRR